MPTRPSGPPAARQSDRDRAPYPYEAIAELLRQKISAGEPAAGEFLPSVKAIAASHAVSVGTAHRAISQLVNLRLVEIVRGRGVRVLSSH
jgi:DNA-binding GntR family transcriptional regulator